MHNYNALIFKREIIILITNSIIQVDCFQKNKYAINVYSDDMISKF